MNFAPVLMAAFVIGGIAGAKIEGWRLNAALKVATENALENERIKNRSRTADYKRVIDAQNAREQRIDAQHDLIVAAGSELERLRGVIEKGTAIVPGVGETAAACSKRAVTLGALLQTCAGEYSEMARVADAHADDLKTILESQGK